MWNCCHCCPTVTAGTPTDAPCFGSTGSVPVNLSPASDGSYTVNGGSAVSFSSGTTFTVSGLAAGTYTIDVTPTGCSATQLVVTVNEPAQPPCLH
ncbi:MAG: hypothetical protein HWD58_10430 [Bacteroidota bacterium]|nr:MAG: hypothetical protein HWD58_10430 [Bacteroidota bacterium]